MPQKYDFSGWATRNDLKCSDGRTIRRDAFADQNGKIVPLVWMHMHNDPANVLGHALLENRPEGVYTYCFLNDSEQGQTAKELVRHKDIVGLSIYANKLKQNGGDVLHGAIREVSLVIAGANPGAYIDSVLTHGDASSDEFVLETYLEHDGMNYEEGEYEEPTEPEEAEEVEEPEEVVQHADSDESEKEEKGDSDMAEEKTLKDVFETLNEEQKQAVYAMIGLALEDANGGDDEGDDEDMKHNVFDSYESEDVLSHADMTAIVDDAKRNGSLKDAYERYVDDNFLQHDDPQTYGIRGIDVLFPDPRAVNDTPVFIKREDSWVSDFLNGARHTPFSRIKSMYADITEEDARARGYMKGKQKKDEVFPIFKRTTPPTTVYKKQKMDRDDIVDITDMDVVAFIKGEMRGMLNEEIARAGLLGDGRTPSSDDKINEQCIRPIYTDTEQQIYAFNVIVTPGADEDLTTKEFIRSIIKARKDYRGSGNPTLYTTEDMLTNMLLLEDGMGRALYDTETALATKLRVKKIVTVPVMDNVSRTTADGTYQLAGIVVNPSDYTFGADKGGSVNMFEDFDIDFNQYKYLIETRCSGALTVPKSAMVVEIKTA